LDGVVSPGRTPGAKTAIPLPDDTFDRALAALPEPDGPSTDAVAAGRALLTSDDDW